SCSIALTEFCGRPSSVCQTLVTYCGGVDCACRGATERLGSKGTALANNETQVIQERNWDRAMVRCRLKRSRSGWREAIFSNSQPNGSRQYRPIQERTTSYHKRI